ncbi:HpcH/HpaI aldolase/citrate lyase family protein [Pollutimonas thiosulfatoxidans]|uniref:CoA ester lyase n=1 Tax=Pollutimonas thiosulfatoxidans TaxID=2028345 RepID=A0A410GCK4_9BURK|nr:CoA ester lyase [Pollutimonas thiosulfatoxidans]QAA94046.1 CoA ester lyase [Pollutimonas thiosulfatoxidans]
MQPTLRSALFVPATRPERYAKALAAGADIVIIDLEDAVAPSLKAEARRHIDDFAAQFPQARFLVRVNDATTSWFDDDLALCAQHTGIVGLMLPKAESAEQIKRAASIGKPVVPIIESARGVLDLSSIAAAQGVDRLSFGALDLMLQLGTRPDTTGASLMLDHIRCQILLHSAAHGLAAALDGVYPDFSDAQGLTAIATQVRDMGFGGMLCIHPAQLAAVHAVFAPTPAELDWAERVVAHADESGTAAFQVDGKMVDAPVIARARRLLSAQ